MPHSVVMANWERDVQRNPELLKPTRATADAMSQEAQFYTEARLLHRDVRVLLQGLDKNGNVYGTVVYQKGDISMKLLSEGLGNVVHWSAALAQDGHHENLCSAAQQGKINKRALHAQYEGDCSECVKPTRARWSGTVTQVNSGDSVTIRNSETNEETQVNFGELRACVCVWAMSTFFIHHCSHSLTHSLPLTPLTLTLSRPLTLSLSASIRTPRMGYRSHDDDEPFALEAWEFVRSRVIGKRWVYV
jgi:endonuclease YncB( thermonuclease family)